MDQDNSELISNNGSFSKELSTHDSTCLDINENDEKFHLLSNSNIKQPSFKNRLIRAYKKLIIISSELTFFLFKVASSMYDPTVRLSAYDKVCVYDFNIDRDICNSHVTNHFSNSFKKVLNRDVQKLAAWHNFIYRMLVNLPAIVISLFTGPWSDKLNACMVPGIVQ
ncbi:hypothetical protein A3Q56_00923 [Intoshia linei]|uniref:Uncharacterized protein n=1 Tax=Intoshia linei TaxID=1819745 RepID=A0A177BCC7_9BILA|nr:hypothetical protein A3Q56_00923 [Intoshia linei]